MCPHDLLLALVMTSLSTLPPPGFVNPVAADLDFTSLVDAVDVQMVINGALGLQTDHETDVDVNQSTDAVDVQLVVNAALGIGIDQDGDGLCDSGEPNAGTVVSNPDTDGDGAGDGRELLLGTDPTFPQPRFTPGAETPGTSASIGQTGGVLSGPAGTPLEGVEVSIPADALPGNVQVTLGYDTGVIQPSRGTPGEAIILLEAPGVWVFDEPVRVTFPLSPGKVADSVPVPYFIDAEGGWHVMDVYDVNESNTAVTVLTWCPTDNGFAKQGQRAGITWVYAKLADSREDDIKSAFATSHDGFQVNNGGSEINPNGECLGMVTFAQWYEGKKAWTEGGFFWRFMETIGTGGRVGQQLIATRAHNSVHRSWDLYNSFVMNRQYDKTPAKQAATIRNAMAESENGVILVLYDGAGTAHAVLAYRCTTNAMGITLFVYDPNHPDNPAVPIQNRPVYSLSYDAFMEQWDYYGGYNRVALVGTYGSLEPILKEDYEDILRDAGEGFHSSRDAVVTVTSHTSGQTVYTSSVTLAGAIESGEVLVDTLGVVVLHSATDDSQYKASIAPDGTFSVPVTLKEGSNGIAFFTFGHNAEDRPVGVLNNLLTATDMFVLDCEVPPSIRGVIFDSRAHVYTPLPNATVRLREDFVGASVYQTTTTNSVGEFSYSGLPDGTAFTLWADAPGYGANMVRVTVGTSSALDARFGLDREFTSSELLGRFDFDIYLGVSGSTAYFDLESGGGGRVNNHSDTPLDWALDGSGEFTMTWWKDTTRTESSKTFHGVVTRGPGWPGDNPIEDGDPVYIWGYMLNDLFPADPPKVFKATPVLGPKLRLNSTHLQASFSLTADTAPSFSWRPIGPRLEVGPGSALHRNLEVQANDPGRD